MKPKMPSHNSLDDQAGEPTWRVALFYPQQGGWTETDYLALDGGPLVEFDDGYVEVQDMPTKEHQRIVQFLFVLLREFVIQHQCGEVFVAPLPVRLWPRKFREPDIVYVSRERGEIEGYPEGADLVIEVVSPGPENRKRDLEIKVAEYATARIDEYWTIDPQTETICVHRLTNNGDYETHAYDKQSVAQSSRLSDFSVSVESVLDSACKQ